MNKHSPISADTAAIEAEAFEAELDRIHALIDARAGYAAPGDPTSAGINRAVSAALAAIDGIGTAACEDRRAA